MAQKNICSVAHQPFIFLNAVVNWGAQKGHEECLKPCGKWKWYSFIQKVWDGMFILWLRSQAVCFFVDELASITTSSFIFVVNWRKGGKLLSWISFNCLWADLSFKHAKCKYVNAIWHAIAFLKVSKHDFYCNYSEKNVHRSFFSFTSTTIMVKQQF